MMDDETLEAVAVKLDGMGGNEIYRKAYRKAARMVRHMKKLTDNSQKLTDSSEQISSVSSACR